MLGFSRKFGVKCSYSNGRKPNSGDDNKTGKSLEEQRRDELFARIASGEFTVEKPRFGFAFQLFDFEL